MIVDAVSAFGALPLDMAAHPEIDAAVFTANKCLEGFPAVALCDRAHRPVAACAGHRRQLVVRSVRRIRPCRDAGRWPPAFYPAGADRECARTWRWISRSGGRPAARLARYTANMRTLYDGMRRLGTDGLIAPEHQGPIIVNVHAPGDPAWHLQRFVDALKPRGVLISNFYNTPTPGFRVGCIGAISPTDMAGAVEAMDHALQTSASTSTGELPDMNPDLEIARAANSETDRRDRGADWTFPPTRWNRMDVTRPRSASTSSTRCGTEGRRAGAGHRHQPDPRR